MKLESSKYKSGEKCPDDANSNQTFGTGCMKLSPKNGYLCSRPKGHYGEHHAHGNEECFEKWL